MAAEEEKGMRICHDTRRSLPPSRFPAEEDTRRKERRQKTFSPSRHRIHRKTFFEVSVLVVRRGMIDEMSSLLFGVCFSASISTEGKGLFGRIRLSKPDRLGQKRRGDTGILKVLKNKAEAKRRSDLLRSVASKAPAA